MKHNRTITFILEFIKYHKPKISVSGDEIFFDCDNQSCDFCNFQKDCYIIFYDRCPNLSGENLKKLKDIHPEYFI